jgi:hypothetical protein
MRLRHISGLALAVLVSLAGVQPESFANSHNGLSGHEYIFGNHHVRIKQPAPIQSTPTVNVRDYGATGNGVTDDTSAIQNAIAAAQASNQGVLFPAGTYLHASTITANGIALIGVGGASTLLANNPTSTAVILTGLSPSIQNIVVSSAQASTGTADTTPTHATLLVQNSQNFTVQGITVVQGVGRVGTYLQQSSVGQVGSVTFNGAGTAYDDGIIVDGCVDVTLIGNLIQNEAYSIQVQVTNGLFVSQSIAVILNTIINGAIYGITVNNDMGGTTNYVDIEQNLLQMSATATNAIALFGGNNYSITGNSTSGASTGIFIQNLAGCAGVVSQNFFRNCYQFGAALSTAPASGTLQFIGNQFGECGLATAADVIVCGNAGGSNSIILLNNIYAGHVNLLQDYIISNTAIAIVTGNVQTQTMLPSSVP